MFQGKPFKEESGHLALRLDERLPLEISIYRNQFSLTRPDF